MRRIGVLMAFAEGDREGQALVAAFREVRRLCIDLAEMTFSEIDAAQGN